MKHKALILGILIVIISIFAGCSGNEFKVNSVVTYPFMTVPQYNMGLAVYVRTTSTKDETVSFEIQNPDKTLTWTVNAVKTPFEDGLYYGSSDIFMPDTRELDCGKWTLTVLSQDGSAEEFTFEVNYIFNYPSPDKTSNFYDENANLTYIYSK